jgi:hypothetical protein
MAITKEIVEDKIEIVGDYKNIQVRTATIIKEDGVELTRSFHRDVLTPGTDLSDQSEEVQGIAAVVWNEDLIASYNELLENQNLNNE